MPTLEEQKPDVAIIHIGSNDITNSNYTTINPEIIAQKVINVGTICKNNGVNDVVISSILVKRNIRVTKIIRQVNDHLKDLCIANNYHYIDNDNISYDHLWKDGIHLKDDGTRILAGNFTNYLNQFILKKYRG